MSDESNINNETEHFLDLWPFAYVVFVFAGCMLPWTCSPIHLFQALLTDTLKSRVFIILLPLVAVFFAFVSAIAKSRMSMVISWVLMFTVIALVLLEALPF